MKRKWGSWSLLFKRKNSLSLKYVFSLFASSSSFSLSSKLVHFIFNFFLFCNCIWRSSPISEQTFCYEFFEILLVILLRPPSVLHIHRFIRTVAIVVTLFIIIKVVSVCIIYIELVVYGFLLLICALFSFFFVLLTSFEGLLILAHYVFL